MTSIIFLTFSGICGGLGIIVLGKLSRITSEMRSEIAGVTLFCLGGVSELGIFAFVATYPAKFFNVQNQHALLAFIAGFAVVRLLSNWRSRRDS